MIIAGEMDDNFPVDGVRQLGAALEAPYTALKASDALEVQIDDEGHHFHEGRQEVAVAFLERWLLKESSTTKVRT